MKEDLKAVAASLGFCLAWALGLVLWPFAKASDKTKLLCEKTRPKWG